MVPEVVVEGVGLEGGGRQGEGEARPGWEYAGCSVQTLLKQETDLGGVQVHCLSLQLLGRVSFFPNYWKGVFIILTHFFP